MRVYRIKEIDQDMINFIAMENSLYKNILYKDEYIHKMSQESSLAFSDDGKVYYAFSVNVIKKGKSHYYMFKKEKGGFTLDDKKKIQFWYGKNINIIFQNLPEILKGFNIDWYDPIFNNFLTKTALEKILSNKITNPIDLCKFILKSNKIDASPRFLYRSIINKSINKFNLLKGARVAKNINHYIEYLNKKDIHWREKSIISDLEDQADILGYKIDYLWSSKRMKLEHDNWTNIIMLEKLEHISDEKIDDLEKYDIFQHKGLKLLYDQKEVYKEGTNMKHCLYTNYWSEIKSKKYLAYHVEYGLESITLGLVLKNDGIYFNQAYGYKNSSISRKMNNFLKNQIIDMNYIFFNTIKDNDSYILGSLKYQNFIQEEQEQVINF